MAEKEQRQLRRWHLIYYLRVFDRETDAFIGHAVDVSTEGLKLVSEWPIPVKKDYQLWMEIPRANGAQAEAKNQVVLNAHSLWSHADESPGFYNTGFRLVSPTTGATENIRKLINELSAHS